WRHLAGRVSFETDALAALVRAPGADELQAALDELAQGMSDVERLARITGRTPVAQLDWLWRLYQIVYRARQLLPRASEHAVRHALATAIEYHQLRPLVDPAVPGSAAAGAGIDPMLDAAGHEFRRL